ncbi:MAG TPA: AMP-binding protein [Anaeromyxobacteraceae bacterium]|nr:AMP-binding protein [Anaeromyxobacteraceae bacterium]
MRLSGPPAPRPRAPTVNALLERASDARSGVTFVDLRERETFVSWAEVCRRARRAAASLAAAGIRPGDRVAIVLRTEPAFLDAFFGVLLAGAVPAPLYPPVRLGRMDEYLAATARMVTVSGARAILAGGAVRRLLGGVVARSRPPLGRRAAEELARGRDELARDVGRDELALVQFSSGSTVDPKPVALTHGALADHVETLLALLRPGDSDALVSWLPLYHDMGLIGGLLGALAYPGPAVLIPPEHFLARPALWLRAMSRHRGTIAAAPSFAYAYCVQRVRDSDLDGVDLSSWRVALDGAEPVSLPVLREFQRRFASHGFRPDAMRPVYGLSEAALAVTFCDGAAEAKSVRVDPVALAATGEIREGPREVASVGRPIPGVQVEIRDAHGRPAGADRLGRIWVAGPSLMSGYLGQAEATAKTLAGGWLDTGDLGFVHDGQLYVHGRAKDVVVVRGANHAPDEFEGALAGVAGLRPGCAVAGGLDVDGRGEELVLLVERARTAAGSEPEIAAAIRQAVTERTGVAPREVVLLAPGSLPRTSSGKMRRAEALRRWLAGTLLPPRPVTPLALAREVARSALGYARARRG